MNISEVFRQIKSVKVKVVQRNRVRDRQADYVGYDETTLVEYVKCFNPACDQGAFRIAPLLREIVNSKSIDRKATADGNGDETPRKGQAVRHACCTQFQVAMHIEYKEEPRRK
jgi:hypothetical protein